MTSICEKKISAKVRLIHAEHVSLYNFIFLRKKTIDTAEDLITGVRHFKPIGLNGFF